MTKSETIQYDALDRATTGQSFANYAAIFEGFMAKGIAEHEIKPRENVLTFNAWKALGRSVKKGEHGVKVFTFITCASKTDTDDTGEQKSYRRPHSTTVFHISQTETTAEREARIAARKADTLTYSRGIGAGVTHVRVDHDPGYVDIDRSYEDYCAEIVGR